MPMSVQHVKNLTMADGTDSNVVRPSDWNSQHAVTLAPTGDEMIGGFSNANGVSFGTNAQSRITASVAVAAALTALSAGTVAMTGPQVSFANGNGISFGANGNTLTASHNGLTTAAQSNHSHGVTVNATNINFTTGGNSDGINLSLSAVVPAQTAFQFSNSNGVSFGTNGSTVTASVQTNYAASNVTTNNIATSNSSLFQHTSATSAITSNAFPTANSTNLLGTGYTTHTHAAYLTTARASNDGIGLNTALTANGVSMTANSSGLSLNFPAFLTTAAPTNVTTNNIATSQSSLFQHTSATSAIPRVAQLNGSSGTMSFAVGSSLSASSNASTITLGLASNITTALQSAGNYLTTAAQSNHSHGNPTLNLTNLTGTTASNSAGFTLSLSAAAPGGGGGAALSAGTQSVSTGTVAFANSNGITFGMSGSNQITASHNGLTTAAQSNHSHGVTLNLTNINGTTGGNSNGINLSLSAVVPAQTVQTQGMVSLNGQTGALSLGVGSSLSSSVNGVSTTFGLASNITTALQSAGAYLTTAAQSNHSHGNPTLNLTNINGTTASNSAGLTLSLSAVVPTQTNQTGNFYALGNTTQLSSTAGLDLRSLSFEGAGVASVGVSNGRVLVSVPAGGGGGDGYNILGVNGAGTSLSATLQLSNANNVTFGLNGSTITASASYPAQTAFVLSNSNNVSFGTNGSTVTATATFNQTVQTQGVSAIAGSGASTVSAGLVQFANGNGISFGLNGSTMTASHNALTTAAATNVTTNNMATAERNNYFYTSNNTFANSTHSHGNPTLALTNLSGTTASASNGLTISLSAGAGGAGDGVNVVQMGAGGNSAGATYSASTGTVHLFGGPNITLSQNNNSISVSAAAPGGGGAVSFSAGTTSGALGSVVFSNANGVSFGLNGSTITASAAAGGGGGVTNTMWFPFNEAVNVMGQQGQGTLHLVPVPTPDIGAATVTFDRLCLPILHSHATNSTGSVTISFWFGLYTRENTTGTKINLEHSTSFSTNYTFSGTANSSILSGLRLITIPWTSSIAGNRYIVALGSRTTTGGANCSVSQLLVSNIASNFSGLLGQATNATRQWPMGWGQYSATTSGLPASIAYSQIYGTNSNAMRNPEWFLMNGTA